MAWRGRADPRPAPGRILTFSLMSFCSPPMVTWPRQSGAGEVGVRRGESGGLGSGE